MYHYQDVIPAAILERAAELRAERTERARVNREKRLAAEVAQEQSRSPIEREKQEREDAMGPRVQATLKRMRRDGLL